MNKSRIRKLNEQSISQDGPVIYWMDRERRIQDNWALIAAYKTALENNQRLIIYYALPANFLGANLRTYDFMLKGLFESFNEALELGMSVKVEIVNPVEGVSNLVKKYGASAVFTDFTPLKPACGWRLDLAKSLEVPLFEVDARNIVPCWVTSDKLEFAARTIRPKIHRYLSDYLDKFPVITPMDAGVFDELSSNFDIEDVLSMMNLDDSVTPVDTFLPGEQAARNQLNDFLQNKLQTYNDGRNDPNLECISNLSPYLHFGHISSQRVVLEVQQLDIDESLKESFVEEIVVRRELADNFCFYSPNYDSVDCAWDWAAKSLAEHRDDPREYTYTQIEFEKAMTHDQLWNAAQKEMVKTGKMHGFMRMYWAKKILEWSATPREAFDIAIYLNNKYELDGRDSNGYTGVAWSICGVHDRAWFERPVFGKIRYMNYNGCKRKFDVLEYINKVNHI